METAFWSSQMNDSINSRISVVAQPEGNSDPRSIVGVEISMDLVKDNNLFAGSSGEDKDDEYM